MFFFFNDTATTEIYTLSLHDALPISQQRRDSRRWRDRPRAGAASTRGGYRAAHRHEPGFAQAELRYRRAGDRPWGSEEHTSELQSRQYLVCRLLLEKKKKISHLHIPF